MADVQNLTLEEFDGLIAEQSTVLVDFYADWCMPCKMMAPVVDKTAAAFDGRAAVAKVNVDDVPELAERYGVQSIPTLLLFKDGTLAKMLVGVRPFEELQTELNSLI